MTDLESELTAALGNLSPIDALLLKSAGIAGSLIGAGLIGVARIRIVAGDLYELDGENGRTAFVTPARSDDSALTPEAIDPAAMVRTGALVDLVAWHPRHPTRWALRTGAAEWLGSIEPQYLDPAPVAIARSPLAWLRAGARGLVPLCREPAAVYRILTCCSGGIIAEDQRHAAALRIILTRLWPATRIVVRTDGRHVAG